MKDSPLISVIVPVYNVEKYLRKCLDSICVQTYRNLEILCVNDGSTDDSAAILEEYAARDARIKVFTQPNGGLAAARNTGLRHATGEWVTGVDSDDYLAPDTYEYALADTTNETDIIVFGTKIIWQGIPEDPAMQEYFNLPYNGIQPLNFETFSHTPVTFWDKLWRASFVKQYGVSFPPGLWYEDTHFFHSLAPFARNISYRPEQKYMYVRRSGSIMSESSDCNPKVLDRLRIAQATLEFYRGNPLPKSMLKCRLHVFKEDFMSTLDFVPRSLFKGFMQMASDIAYQYGLIQEYPAQLRFLQRVPWWLRPFVKHKISKSYYSLFGIPIVVIVRHQHKELYRILGIKIQRPYKDV